MSVDFKAFSDKVVALFSVKFEEAKVAAVEAIEEVQAAAELEIDEAVSAVKAEAVNVPAKAAFSGSVQATVREGDVVHFQAGNLGKYTKGDTTNSFLANKVRKQIVSGKANSSFYGSKTQYATLTYLGSGMAKLADGTSVALPSGLGV